MPTMKTARSVFICSVSLLLASFVATASENSKSPQVYAIWSNGVKTPAVCLGRAEWFVSIVPESLDASELSPPSLEGDATDAVETDILFLDEQRRICLVQSAESLGAKPMPLASNSETRAGLKLLCREGTETCKSTIAGKDSSYRGEILSPPMLRIRVAGAKHFGHPGASLINEKGEIEGILTERVLEHEYEAHAIPASQLRKLIFELEHFKRSGPVWVGLLFHDQSSTPIVLEVRPDSPASEAGIEAGDIVLHLNQVEIEDLGDLIEAIHDLAAGEDAELTLLRGLDEISLHVVPTFSQASASPAP